MSFTTGGVWVEGGLLVSEKMHFAVIGIEKNILDGLLTAGTLVKLRSMERTPVKTGVLKNSHTVEVDPAKMEVEISANTDYAKYVHEILEYFHSVGEAKFLEKAFKSSTRDIVNILFDAAKVDNVQ